MKKSLSSFFGSREDSRLNLAEQSKQTKVELSVRTGTDLEKQLKLIELTKEDLAYAKTLQPIVQEHITEIVDAFYNNLQNAPELMSIINNNSSIERLKNTLSVHLVEMFDGTMDENYFEKRIRIARAHVAVGLTQN